MSWTQLQDTGIWVIARDYYEFNRCAYHNMNHIQECYDFLESEKAPYSIELDMAVLCHDIVYDSKPDKELRSAELMTRRFASLFGNDLVVHEAAEIINATIDHKFTCNTSDKIKWMIRADLHGLASREESLTNYFKIMAESKFLYNCTSVEFAEANAAFMTKLKETVMLNQYLDKEYAIFWDQVLDGIKFTRRLSNTIAN